MEQSVQQRILIFLWQWCSARNKANAGTKMATATEICTSVPYHIMQWDNTQNKNKSTTSMQLPKWQPPHDFLKLNCDASFHQNTGNGGWGFVVRNEDKYS
jgi:hypothetical protein